MSITDNLKLKPLKINFQNKSINICLHFKIAQNVISNLRGMFKTNNFIYYFNLVTKINFYF